MGESGNVLLRYRFGSATSYLFAEPRGPKLAFLSMGGSNVHASKQLEELMPIPSLPSHAILHPRGKGGRSGADTGDESDMLSSSSGNTIVPSPCRGTVLEKLDVRVEFGAVRSPLGRADFGTDSAGDIG